MILEEKEKEKGKEKEKEEEDEDEEEIEKEIDPTSLLICLSSLFSSPSPSSLTFSEVYFSLFLSLFPLS